VVWLFLLYVLFVVYGSLVPLQYVGRPLDEAIAAFQAIPFLTLGIESRADWVANGVLYVPVGLLTALLLSQKFRGLGRAATWVLAGCFACSLAVAVEFAQLFFPPRTVSLNDLLAEAIGSVVGLALAARFGRWFEALVASFRADPARLPRLLLQGYVAGYVAYALFPYDLLVSAAEIANKADSDSWAWWLADSSRRFSLAAAQLMAECLLAAPFGLLLARSRRTGVVPVAYAAMVGLLLGVVIELAQFFIASGISQGASVLARAAGVCAGVVLYQQRAAWSAERTRSVVRRYTLPLCLVYLTALLALNGWLPPHWAGWNAAQHQLAQLSLVPFYYHYYTTEALALLSLTAVSAAYAPVGVLVWAHHRTPALAMATAAPLAMLIEAGKLFMPAAHPDPTNVLLAGGASALTALLLQRVATYKPVIAGADPQSKSPVSIWPALCLLATGVWLVGFPAFQAIVLMVLLASAATIWYRPVWLFAIVPAALPVFDLAPWSGRFFWDEFDALLLLGLAVAYARTPATPANPAARKDWFTWLTLWLMCSFAISTVRGLMPWAPPDLNAFNSYLSPYNALRLGKGAVWAWLLFGLARRLRGNGIDAHVPFTWGMVTGLMVTTGVVVWERMAFSALGDFSDGYRVTGLISASHTGGAYIDCFIAAAIPYLMLITFTAHHRALRMGWMLLLMAAIYALMVTFSRGGLASLGLVTALVLLFRLRHIWLQGRGHYGAMVLTGAIIAAVLPIFFSDFVQSRVSNTGDDLQFRQAHWRDALAIRNTDWATSAFGMGLGTFPSTKYWRSTLHPRMGTYSLANEANNNFLRLGGGDAIGLDQFVDIKPGQTYWLKLDVRPSTPGGTLTVPICEKSLLTSATCITPSFQLGDQVGEWRSLATQFSADTLAVKPWYSQRPVKLSLTVGNTASTIDIDNVTVLTEQNTKLLRNGDFASGLDSWLLAAATPLHAHWRTNNLYLGVLFDQGWFGLIALGSLLASALALGLKKCWQGPGTTIAPVAALLGFLTGGMADTQIDAPRFLLLLLMLTYFCAYSTFSQRAKGNTSATASVVT